MKRQYRILLFALAFVILAFAAVLMSCDKNGSGGGDTTDHTKHTFGDWITEKEASCETDGKSIRKCTDCDATEEQIIPKLGHELGSYVSDNNAGCGDGTKTAVCVNGCGKTDTVTDEGSGSGLHTLEYLRTDAATCTEDAKTVDKCTGCDYTKAASIAPATGHSVTSYTVKSKTAVAGSDCTYKVEFVGSCTKCGSEVSNDNKTEVSHRYTASIKTAATCSANGTKEYKCIGCNDLYTESYSDADAHSWAANGSPVNGVQAYKCSRTACSATKNVIISSGTTHTVDKSQLAGVGVSLSGISLELDSAALGGLSAGNVTLGAKTLGTSERNDILAVLSVEQKALIGDRPIYDFELKQGSTVISEFNGMVKITVPYALKTGEDVECIAVWYLADDGSIESVAAKYSSGYVTFEVEHFSVYTVTSVTPELSCEANGHDYQTGNATAAPTCTSVGYTTKTCIRCGKSSVGNIVAETGHRYTATPEKTDPSCNAKGKYVYTCSVLGCGHKQEIPIDESHNWSETDYLSSSCRKDGYIEYECTLCHKTKRDILLADPASHDTAMGYKLVEGGTTCTDGVVIYDYCKTAGCDYYTEYEVRYAHTEDRDNLPQITPTKIDLREYFPELYSQGDEGGYITVTPYFCICQQIHQSVTIDGGYPFSGMGYYSVDRFSQTEGEQIYNSQCVGAPSEETCKYIKTVTRIVENGCFKSYYLDIMLDYKPSTGNAAKTLTFLMDSEVSHVSTYNIYPVFQGGQCEDGVILEWECLNCGEVTGRETRQMSYGEHFYIYNQLPYDMSQYATNDHKPKIVLGTCICGCRQYIVTYDNAATYNQKCSFISSYEYPSSNVTEITYTCSCGFKYMERQTVTLNPSSCVTRRITQKIFYNYNSSTGEYDSSITITGNIDTISHVTETRDVERNEIGTCYVEYTNKIFCKYCNKPCNEWYEYNGVKYEHDLVREQYIDDMGNTVLSESCADCGYFATWISDSEGNPVKSHTFTVDPKAQTKTEIIINYRDENGINEQVYNKQTVYGLDGSIISWKQVETIYAYGTSRGDIKNVITVLSDGTVSVTETLIS